MRYPLFGLGLKGKSTNVTAQERVNCYAELQAEEDKTVIAYYALPGKDLFVDLGGNPARNEWALSVNTFMYSVNGDEFYQVNNAGIATLRGTLNTSSGYVCMADNGTEILIVDGTNGYVFNTQTNVFAQIVDPNFPNGCTTCAFLGGRLVVEVPDSGTFQWTPLYDALTWPAANVATAEQSPDNLVAVFVDAGKLFLIGDKTTEFWAVTASADQPFALISGAVIEWGIAAKASIVKYNNSTVWLARNRLGQVQVIELVGFTATMISGPELGFTINEYTVVENATAFAYMVNEHPMYQINFPTGEESWVHDQSNRSWNRAMSGYAGRDLANFGVNFVNKVRVSSHVDGKIYTLNPTTYTEDGATIRRKIVGRHVFDELPISVAQLQIDMETGTGNAVAPGDDPQLMLRVSIDGGHSWSSQLWASVGKAGEYLKQVFYRRLGLARQDWLFEITHSDPTKFAIVGAWLNINGVGRKGGR